MQTSESGASAKSLRGRESTRKQDPSDKVLLSVGPHGTEGIKIGGGRRGESIGNGESRRGKESEDLGMQEVTD
jgi:hypothetical protein